MTALPKWILIIYDYRPTWFYLVIKRFLRGCRLPAWGQILHLKVIELYKRKMWFVGYLVSWWCWLWGMMWHFTWWCWWGMAWPSHCYWWWGRAWPFTFSLWPIFILGPVRLGGGKENFILHSSPSPPPPPPPCSCQPYNLEEDTAQ